MSSWKNATGMNKKKLYDEMPCSHSVEEVRENVLEAIEHDNDPDYWTTWEAMESRLRNKYPEWR